MNGYLSTLKHSIKNSPLTKGFSRRIFEQIPVITRLELSEALDNPYSKLESDNKIVFIHIPKTAGNSIIKSLFGMPATGHHRASQYQKFSAIQFEDSFKFAFVRNPWDRLVSAYHYLKQGGIGVYDIEFRDKYLSNFNNFDDFLHKLSDPLFSARITRWPHFKPQTTYLLCQDNKISIDFMGRFETIQNDYEEICRILRISRKLNTENSSNHKDYRTYYRSSRLIEIVSDVYAADCELLNYEFEK